MIELTQEEKDILIGYKDLLQQNKLEEVFENLIITYSNNDKIVKILEHITQFLVDKLGVEIFNYLKNINYNMFSYVDFSHACNGTLKIPEHIKGIYTYAFFRSKGYDTVILHTSNIGEMAFRKAEDLQKIIITKGNAQEIVSSRSQFEGCINVKDLYLPCTKEEWHTAWYNASGIKLKLGEIDNTVARRLFDSDMPNLTIHWK